MGRLFWAFLGVVLVLAACGDDDSGSKCATGDEGCACFANSTCNGSLSCKSKLCVKLGSTNADKDANKIAGGSKTHSDAGSGSASPADAGNETPQDTKSDGSGDMKGDAGAQEVPDAGEAKGDAGTQGASGAGGSDGSGGTSSAACLEAGDACSNDPTDCCVGTTCVNDARMPNAGTCAALCTGHSECNSGCCVQLNNVNAAVCAPAQYCAPPPSVCPGAPCVANSDCCIGFLCVQDVGCSAQCSHSSECVSNCCSVLVFPGTNTPNGFGACEASTGSNVCAP